MKTNEIVSEIAHLLRQREASFKDPKEIKEIKSKHGATVPQDEVTLTSTAKSYANLEATSSEMEKEQFLKVERLKSLVNGGSYKLDDSMVESIAERIANMLV